jgi:hypothetical protein
VTEAGKNDIKGGSKNPKAGSAPHTFSLHKTYYTFDTVSSLTLVSPALMYTCLKMFALFPRLFTRELRESLISGIFISRIG